MYIFILNIGNVMYLKIQYCSYY